MKFMLDSNVLRHIAAQEDGHQNITTRILEVGISNLSISVVVSAEVHKAIHNHKLQRTERAILRGLLSSLNVISFDEAAAETAGTMAAKSIRRGKILPGNDYLIGGHALHLGCTLVTDNIKHFDGVIGLKVQNWLRPK
jgi:tRNA(fMet)-specific endonuclease VapC